VSNVNCHFKLGRTTFNWAEMLFVQQSLDWALPPATACVQQHPAIVACELGRFRQRAKVTRCVASPERSLLPIKRPRCSKCQGRMMLARIEPGPNGSTLRKNQGAGACTQARNAAQETIWHSETVASGAMTTRREMSRSLLARDTALIWVQSRHATNEPRPLR